MNTLGDRVKDLRVKKEMNQKKLSESSGITQATISRIENGKVKQLKSEALKRLSEALGTTIDYLMGKRVDMNVAEMISVDKQAEYIFRGYEKLSGKSRQELEDFVKWLENREMKYQKGR